MEEKKLIKRKHKYLKENNKMLLAGVCIDLAELYLREGNYEKCIEEYKIAAKIYKETNEHIEYAQVNRMIGEAYFGISQYEKALSYQQIHLEVAKKNNNKLEEQRALATIGRTYLTSAIDDPDAIDKDNLQLAYKAFKKSLMICESLKNITKHEQMDMRSRLLLNIGVVHENQGKLESAIEYMMQSIKICKANDIYDQLHQCYSSLGYLYAKNNDYSKAISTFNLAYDVAGYLSDKIPPMIATLMAKADIFCKLVDFQSAKQALLKAHKLKSPNKEERALIERNLKVVAALTYTEDSLLTTADSDYKVKKKLYEKLGDGACELKIFDKAIDYYKKMLEFAELSGEFGKELIPCYVSLAQTYKDNKNYDLALEYFQKEYQLCCDNPKESYNTLLNIAEVMELSNKSFEEIKEVFEKAKTDGSATKEVKIEGKVIEKYVGFLKKNKKFTEASALEKELVLMDYTQSSDSEDSNSENGTPNIGEDIAISDITDISDASETEDIDNVKRTRKRGRGITFKKNSKGETPLHVACIAGNQKLVHRLLEQGHPVNIRDNCGWMPLHEACNYGFKEIVELLVEKGANVNDRGGSGCNGMTPLHDACCNGHLEVIEYLLDHGASVLAQNDSGETPLDILQNYRDQTTLDPITQTYYETLVIRMMTVLEKAGRPFKKSKNSPEEKRKRLSTPSKHEISSKKSKTKISPYTKTSPAFSRTKSFSSPSSSFGSPDSHKNSAKKIKSPRGQPIGTLRHIIDNGSSDDEETPKKSQLANAKERLKNRTAEVSSSLNEKSAKDEYKRVMESLRHRIPESSSKTERKGSNKSAYVLTQEAGDNWLEDDLNINRPSKKRKFGTIIKQNYIETVGARKSNSPIKVSRLSDSSINLNQGVSEKRKSFNYDDDDENVFQIDLTPSEFAEPVIDVESSNDSFTSSSFNSKRKKSQLSLLEAGFSRTISPEPNLKRTSSSSSLNRSHKRQPKISNFTVPNEILEPDSTTSITLDSSRMESTLNLNPQVLSLPQMQTQTQAQPMRAMYAITVRIENKLWRVPVPANEIDNLTIGWLANEASKRYYSKEGILPTLQLETKDGAFLDNEDPLSIVFLSPTQPEEVQSTVVSWNLPPLPERYLEACNILKNEVDSRLREKLDETQGTLNLNLANFELRKQIGPLFRALNRENNLRIIDLTSSNLLNEGLQQLTQALPSLSQLKTLNLALNNITSEGLRYLSEIFSEAQKPILENLVDLNLSYNLLGDESLRHLETISKFTKLRTLDLTACNFTDSLFEFNNFVNLNFGFLETLNLSYNELDSRSIIKFISFLNFKHITSLNFSNNFVSESGILREISFNLQHSSSDLRYLNLANCKVNDAEIWDFLRLLPPDNHLETLDLSYNCDLTSVSLRRLIEHSQPPKNINLEGCDNILKYFSDGDSVNWNFNQSFPSSTLKSLKLTVDYVCEIEKTELLTRIWEQEWGNKARVEKMLDCFLHLSVAE